MLNVVPQPFEHCRKQLLAGCFGSLLYYIKEQPSVWIFWVPKTFLCVLVFIPDNASHLEFGCSRRMICITYFSQKNYDLMFPLIFLSYSYHNFYFMQIRANCFVTQFPTFRLLTLVPNSHATATKNAKSNCFTPL